MTKHPHTIKIVVAIILLVSLALFHINGANIIWNLDINNSDSFILFKEIRFPRTVTAILAGSSISIAGLLMQTLFKNTLAGPSILGITRAQTFPIVTSITTQT